MIDFADGNWKPWQLLDEDHVEFSVEARCERERCIPSTVGI
jgi:hypothetical protein